MGSILGLICGLIVFLVSLRMKCVLCNSSSNQECSKNRGSNNRATLNSFLENVLKAQNELEWIKQLSKSNDEDQQYFARPARKRDQNIRVPHFPKHSGSNRGQIGINNFEKPAQMLPFNNYVPNENRLNKVPYYNMPYLQNNYIPLESPKTYVDYTRNQRFNHNNELNMAQLKDSYLRQSDANSKRIRVRSALREVVENHKDDPEVLQYLVANKDKINNAGDIRNQEENSHLDDFDQRYWSIKNDSPRSEKDQEIEDEFRDKSSAKNLDYLSIGGEMRNIEDLRDYGRIVPFQEQGQRNSDPQSHYRNEDPTVTKYFEKHGRVRNTEQEQMCDGERPRKVGRSDSAVRNEFLTRTQQKHEEERQRLQLEDADGLLKGVRVSSPIGSTDNQMALNKLNQGKFPAIKIYLPNKFRYQEERERNIVDRTRSPYHSNNVNEELKTNKDNFGESPTVQQNTNNVESYNEGDVQNRLQNKQCIEDHHNSLLKEDLKFEEPTYDKHNDLCTGVKTGQYEEPEIDIEYDFDQSKQSQSNFLNGNSRSISQSLEGKVFSVYNDGSISDSDTDMSSSSQTRKRQLDRIRQERALSKRGDYENKIDLENNVFISPFDQQSSAIKQNVLSLEDNVRSVSLADSSYSKNKRLADGGVDLNSMSSFDEDLDASRDKRTAVKRPGAIWQDDKDSEDASEGEEGMNQEHSDIDSGEKNDDRSPKIEFKETSEKEGQVEGKQIERECKTNKANQSKENAEPRPSSTANQHLDDAERLKASYIFSSTFDSSSERDKNQVQQQTSTTESKESSKLVRDKRSVNEVVNIQDGNSLFTVSANEELVRSTDDLAQKKEPQLAEPVSQLSKINLQELLKYLTEIASKNNLDKRSLNSNKNSNMEESVMSIDQTPLKMSDKSNVELKSTDSADYTAVSAVVKRSLSGKCAGGATRSAVDSTSDIVLANSLKDLELAQKEAYVAGLAPNSNYNRGNSNSDLSQLKKVPEYIRDKINSRRSLLSVPELWDNDSTGTDFSENPVGYPSETSESEKLKGEASDTSAPNYNALKLLNTNGNTNSFEISKKLDIKPNAFEQERTDDRAQTVVQVKQTMPASSGMLAEDNFQGKQAVKSIDVQSLTKEEAKVSSEIKQMASTYSLNVGDQDVAQRLHEILPKEVELTVDKENFTEDESKLNESNGRKDFQCKGEKHKEDEDELEFKTSDQHLSNSKSNGIRQEIEFEQHVSHENEENKGSAAIVKINSEDWSNVRVKRSSKIHKVEDEDELEYTTDEEDRSNNVKPNRRNIKQQIGRKAVAKSSKELASEEQSDETSLSAEDRKNESGNLDRENDDLNDDIERDEMILANTLKESHNIMDKDRDEGELLEITDNDFGDDVNPNIKSNFPTVFGSKSKDNSDTLLKVLDSDLKLHTKELNTKRHVGVSESSGELGLKNRDNDGESSDNQVSRSLKPQKRNEVRRSDEGSSDAILSDVVNKANVENKEKLIRHLRNNSPKLKAKGVERIQRSNYQDEHIKQLQEWAQQLHVAPPLLWVSRDRDFDAEEVPQDEEPHVRCTQPNTCSKPTPCPTTCKPRTTTCKPRTTTCKPRTTTCKPHTTPCKPRTTTCRKTTTCRPACPRPTTVRNCPCRRPTRPKPCSRIATCRSTCPSPPPRTTTCPTTCPTAAAPKCMKLNKQCPQAFKPTCNSDDDYKGELDDGQLGMDIVSTIFQHVDKTPCLKEHVGPGLKFRYQPTAIHESDDYRLRSKEMLNQIMQIIDRSVEEEIKRRTCSHLPSDLKEFITWLMKTGTKCNSAPTSAPFLFKKPCKKKPTKCPETCTTKCPKPTVACTTKCPKPSKSQKCLNPSPHTLCPPPADVQQKITLLQKLICEYNHLTSSEQVEVKPVHDYLVKQLKFLKSLVKQCKSCKSDNSQTPGCDTCNMSADDEKHIEELIEKDLESLGLGPRAMLSSNIGNKFISNSGSSLMLAHRSVSDNEPSFYRKSGETGARNGYIRKHRSFDYEIPIEYELKSSHSDQQSPGDFSSRQQDRCNRRSYGARHAQDENSLSKHKKEKKHLDDSLSSERHNGEHTYGHHKHKQRFYPSSKYKRLVKRAAQLRRKRRARRRKRALNKS